MPPVELKLCHIPSRYHNIANLVSVCVGVCTWKTLGADTRQAKAEDSVAPNIPAVMRGAKADTMLID